MASTLPPPTTQSFKPLNREPSPETLISRNLTSATQSYDRNHGPIPHLDISSHRINISDTTSTPLLDTTRSFSVPDLKVLGSPKDLTCALQCAGNRRHDMRTKIHEVSGIDWGNGAVMNCIWTGLPLSDLLSHVLNTTLTSLPASKTANKHLAFACHAVACEEDSYFGSSVPLSYALDPASDILLAWAQNGTDLTPEHGYPLRLVVPGIAGARSVKWLDSITIQDSESSNFYMQRDYKILPPEATDTDTAERYWDKVSPLMEMPVNSVIVFPNAEATDNVTGDDGVVNVQLDERGAILVKGYALPGGAGGPITRVEIRIDDDGEWSDAELLDTNDSEVNDHKTEDGKANDSGKLNNSNDKWTWKLFQWHGPLSTGTHTIWSRATDSAGHRQEMERSEWNLRGVAYNGFGEVRVCVS